MEGREGGNEEGGREEGNEEGGREGGRETLGGREVARKEGRR